MIYQEVSFEKLKIFSIQNKCQLIWRKKRAPEMGVFKLSGKLRKQDTSLLVFLLKFFEQFSRLGYYYVTICFARFYPNIIILTKKIPMLTYDELFVTVALIFREIQSYIQILIQSYLCNVPLWCEQLLIVFSLTKNVIAIHMMSIPNLF